MIVITVRVRISLLMASLGPASRVLTCVSKLLSPGWDIGRDPACLSGLGMKPTVQGCVVQARSMLRKKTLLDQPRKRPHSAQNLRAHTGLAISESSKSLP